MKILNSIALAVVAAIALAGCSTTRTYGGARNIELTQLDQLPSQPMVVGHRIGPQELLNINVLNADLLSGKFLTDASGQLDYPMVGKVNVNGLTPDAAGRLIENELRGRVVLEPQVTVVPSDFRPQSFSIGGEVARPGEYPATGNLSLMRAMNIAGGKAEFAKMDEVLVFRTVDGQKYIGVFNLAAIQQGNYDDPRLYPDDVVMVGDSPGRRRLEQILQFVPVLTSTLILIDRLGN